jgi:hypothetical protein
MLQTTKNRNPRYQRNRQKEENSQGKIEKIPLKSCSNVPVKPSLFLLQCIKK